MVFIEITGCDSQVVIHNQNVYRSRVRKRDKKVIKGVFIQSGRTVGTSLRCGKYQLKHQMRIFKLTTPILIE